MNFAVYQLESAAVPGYLYGVRIFPLFLFLLSTVANAATPIFEVEASGSIGDTIGDWLGYVRWLQSQIERDESRFYRGSYSQYRYSIPGSVFKVIAINQAVSLSAVGGYRIQRESAGIGISYRPFEDAGFSATAFPIMIYREGYVAGADSKKSPIQWPYAGLQFEYLWPVTKIPRVDKFGMRALVEAEVLEPEQYRFLFEVFFEVPILTGERGESLLQKISLLPRCVYDYRGGQSDFYRKNLSAYDFGRIQGLNGVPQCMLDTKVRWY